MDRKRAVDSFRRNAAHFSQLPFLTDGEVFDLYGEEVGRVLRQLDDLNRERRVCSGCGGECCEQMCCEIFAPEFEGCPVHDCRPLLCRFHFCADFAGGMRAEAIALRDICLESTVEAEAGNPVHSALELNVLLYGSCRRPDEKVPFLIVDLRRIMAAAEHGAISWQEAGDAVRRRVQSYRASAAAFHPSR